MLLSTETVRIHCPYCGEFIAVVADASLARQHYVEDCPVCCRPMELSVSVDDERVSVAARRDDE